MPTTQVRRDVIDHKYLGHSQRWLESYARALTVDEIRLIQGFRGLSERMQQTVSVLMMELALQHATKTLHGRSAEDELLLADLCRLLMPYLRAGVQ